MSGVYYTDVIIPNDLVRGASIEDIKNSIVRQSLAGLSGDYERLMTISETNKPEIDATQYYTVIAMLSVDDYKELKEVERHYYMLKERMRFLVDESEPDD